MKLLEKALYTVGGLLAGGILAFNVACSQPSPPPTPTTATTAPAATQVAPTSTTASATTAAPYRGLSFEHLLIQQPNCDKIITLTEFSRQPNPNREGWDIASGTLFYTRLPGCGRQTELETRTVPTLQGIFLFNASSGGAHYGFYLWPMARWEKGGEAGLISSTDEVRPYSTVKMPFSFEVPHIIEKITFGYNIADNYGGAWEYIAPNSKAMQLADKSLSPVPPVVNDSVTGDMPSKPIDMGAYKKWFESQISSMGVDVPTILSRRDNLAKHFGNELEVTTKSFDRSGNKIEISIELRNMTTTKDINLSGSFIPLYLLAFDGTVISTYGDRRLSYSFTFERTKLPPGYNSKGTLTIQIPDNIPQDARYMVGTLSLLNPLHAADRPAIVDLYTLKSSSP